jgi:hypothetical protein
MEFGQMTHYAPLVAKIVVVSFRETLFLMRRGSSS